MRGRAARREIVRRAHTRPTTGVDHAAQSPLVAPQDRCRVAHSVRDGNFAHDPTCDESWICL
eukprot:5934044-Prymnesium_polylepis.1